MQLKLNQKLRIRHMNKPAKILLLAATGAVALTVAAVHAKADDNMKNKGVGPVKTITLEALNAQLATKGKGVFEAKCSACHKVDSRYVGPALLGVTQRRSPEWIMNMILNPAEMTQKDPIATDLLGEYLTQMPFQNVTQDDTRAILEFFRQNDSKAKK